MTTTIAWEYYRSLLAVLKHGSLSGAARALGITQPTVGSSNPATSSAAGRSRSTRRALTR